MLCFSSLSQTNRRSQSQHPQAIDTSHEPFLGWLLQDVRLGFACGLERPRGCARSVHGRAGARCHSPPRGVSSTTLASLEVRSGPAAFKPSLVLASLLRCTGSVVAPQDVPLYLGNTIENREPSRKSKDRRCRANGNLWRKKKDLWEDFRILYSEWRWKEGWKSLK